MKHIVIDFEMQHGEMQLLQSAPNVYQTEIIEIGAVMLNDEFEFVSEFKSYVHPSYGKLSDNIAILTGIKDSDIRDAPLISEAVSSLFAWIGDGEFTVYAWSTADYTQLSRELAGKELAHIIEGFLDTLSVENRVIFLRRYWFSDTYSDIAQRVGLTEKNISVRLTRTRKQMREYLLERGVLV